MRSRLQPFTIIVIAVVVLAGAGIVMFASGGSSEGNPPDEKKASTLKPALTVSTVRPLEMQLPIRLTANGNIEAWQEATIGSELNGLRLREVHVNVGDTVHAGEVLATFAGESVEAEVAQARANLMEAEANAADAVANAERARLLKESGALSAQQIGQIFAAELSAKARVEAAKALLAAQQLRLQHVQVVAPDSGIISERKATVGAVAGAGAELFRMIRKGRLEWRAEVTADELGRVKPGAEALVTAANGTQLKGKVRTIAPTVDPQSRSALVYVDLHPSPADAAPAKAGMYARGEFDLGVSDALTVPQQAVVMREAFSYVFRVNPDGRVSQLKIQTGRRVGDRVEVRGGLARDAVVVAAGAGFLNDGDMVRIGEEARPSSGSAQPAPVSRQ